MTDRKKPALTDEPCEAEAIPDGVVAVEGPDGMQVEMTPRAALETARNLSDAAIDALMDKDAANTKPAARKKG